MVRVAAGGAFSVRSVHLDARRIKPQCVIYDFMCSVHLDARPNHTRNVILTLFSIHDFVQQVALYDSDFPCGKSAFLLCMVCVVERRSEHFQIQKISAIMTALFNLNKGISHAKSKR